jgi:hypothetical protein
MPKDQKVTLDEVVEVIGGEVRKTGDKYFDFLQKTVSSHPLGGTELGGKGKNCAVPSRFVLEFDVAQSPA